MIPTKTGNPVNRTRTTATPASSVFLILQQLAQGSNAEGSVAAHSVNNCGGQPAHGVDLCDVEHIPLAAFQRL